MPTPRRLLAVLALGATACALPGPTYRGRPARTGEESLRRFAQEVHLAHVDRDPTLRRRLGLDWVGRWLARRDPARREVEAALVQRELDWLASAHPREALAAESQLDWRLLAHLCREELASLAWADHESLPRPGDGPHLAWVAELGARPVDDADQARAWIAAAEEAAAGVERATADLRDLVERGFSVPRPALARVLAESRGVLAGRPFRPSNREAPVYAHFVARVAALEDVEAERRTRLLEEAEESLRTRLGVAYEQWIATLADLERRAGEDRGVWRLPDGDEYYRYRVARVTGFDVSPEEVERRAANLLAATRSELARLAVQLDHPGGLDSLLRFARSEPGFRGEGGRVGPGELLEVARERVAAAEQAREQVLLPAPVTPLAVAPRTAGELAGSPYVPGQGRTHAATWRPNFTNPAEWTRARLALEAYLMGWPGRHLRTSVLDGRVDLPDFRRQLDEPAWAEGWDLYALRVAEEIGLVDDPYVEVARRELEQWSAAIAVADVGLNLRRWSPAETVAWLERSTARPSEVCAQAVDSMLTDPATAVAPAIGLATLTALRARAEQALGSDFDSRAFHDRVLFDGPLPLRFLEAQIDAWLEER